MHRVPLDHEAVERLIKLLGMLGSTHDGERAAAGLKAHEFIKQRGLCWADVISLPISRAGAHDDREHDDYETDFDSWSAQRQFCLRYRKWLTSKELGFLISIGNWRGELTERQQIWLDSIQARLRGEAA
jgi:hypothetical protein